MSAESPSSSRSTRSRSFSTKNPSGIQTPIDADGMSVDVRQGRQGDEEEGEVPETSDVEVVAVISKGKGRAATLSKPAPPTRRMSALVKGKKRKDHDDLDSDDLDGSDEGEEIKIDDVSSRSVTPSLPLKRRELDPEHAVASKKAPTIGKRSPAKPPKPINVSQKSRPVKPLPKGKDEDLDHDELLSDGEVGDGGLEYEDGISELSEVDSDDLDGAPSTSRKGKGRAVAAPIKSKSRSFSPKKKLVAQPKRAAAAAAGKAKPKRHIIRDTSDEEEQEDDDDDSEDAFKPDEDESEDEYAEDSETESAQVAKAVSASRSSAAASRGGSSTADASRLAAIEARFASTKSGETGYSIDETTPLTDRPSSKPKFNPPVKPSQISDSDESSALSSDDDTPLASKTKAKTKKTSSANDAKDLESLQKHYNTLEAKYRKVATTALRREMQRTQKKISDIEQREVKTKQKELQKKLKRKLTQGERNAIALHEHHPELKTLWGDLEADIKPIKPIQIPAPAGLKLKLLPFQKESLYWMKEQEKGLWKGGMLADEMGMGKTIQTIALLLSDNDTRTSPNLVVAPVVALRQWKSEIETHADGLKVVIWHGAGRGSSKKDLQKFDVVLTSYGTLQSSYKKQVEGFKRSGQIIKEDSVAHSFEWHRVILDEAHNIKERQTNVAKACFSLDAKYKWCLSGTPLQNKVGELYSLVRFIGGDPYSYYFCKGCPCKSLHWSFKDRRHCDECGHTPMQHCCLWNNEILNPIVKYGTAVGEGVNAWKKMKLLLDRMMLRRTKLERADDLGLPPRTLLVRRDYFSPAEKEIYLSLFSDAKRQFSTYLDAGTLLNNYSNIFTLITRMRQLACHPDLVIRSKTSSYIEDLDETTICRLCHEVGEDVILSKCHHAFDRECISTYLAGYGNQKAPCPVCNCSITIDCDAEAVEQDPEKVKIAKQGILGRLNVSEWKSSTKLEALVEELDRLRAEDVTTKTLVFSQFVSFLDIVAFRLKRAGFKVCRLEGGMTMEARQATIDRFNDSIDVTVFLISLKAGGVALNLTTASRVIMCDSWWNPAVEYQAMDRIHRLGQHRPVTCTKLCIEDSIESKIIELQLKKLHMAASTLNDDQSSMGKLTQEDLSFLFRM